MKLKSLESGKMRLTQNELYTIYNGLLERQYKIEIMLSCVTDCKYLIDGYNEERIINNELINKVRMELNYNE